MTRPNFDFAAEDRSMSRRAVWLLTQEKLSIKADKLDDVIGVLLDTLGEPESTIRWRKPLARFGMERWRDAQWGDQQDARKAVNRTNPRPTKESRDILAADIAATELRSLALPELRRGESALVKAAKILAKAESSNKANKLALEKAFGTVQPSALARVILALVHLGAAAGLVGNRSSGGLRWLTRTERDIALSRAFLELREVGLGYGELAFLAGFAPKECAPHRSASEKMRQRLMRAAK